MRPVVLIASTLLLCLGISSCKKTDPARPQRREYIEADVTSFDVNVFPTREWEEYYLDFTDPLTSIKYTVNLFPGYPNCTVSLSRFNLFTPATHVTDPSVPTGYETMFTVAGINDSLDFAIRVDSATDQQTGYLGTKNLLLHFTPDIKVTFMEFSANSIKPYLQTGGLTAAKAFYEDMLAHTCNNNSSVTLVLKKY